jgi:hypothetical protein
VKRISRNDLGYIEDCVPFIGRYAGNCPLNKVVRGQTDYWVWETVDANVIDPNFHVIILYISDINIGRVVGIKSYINILNQYIKDNKGKILATIRGILINDILFLNERLKSTKELSFDLTTDDEITGRDGTIFNDMKLYGTFNIKDCLFYCKL